MSAPAPSMYSEQAAATAAGLGLKVGLPNLEVFSRTLQELAEEDSSILAVTSDSRGSGKLGPYGKAFPGQIVELGIAEQNLVGVAAGLASTGKKVFAVSPACFLTARSLEQIKNDVAYSDNAVTLIGISAGVSYGALGSTHHSLHDLAALRAINNLTIVAPADNGETAQAIRSAAALGSPVYVRFGKAPLYDLPVNEEIFSFGKARILREGSDIGFIATGETVIHALLAAAQLEKQGLSCRVASMHTVKPLDHDVVLQTAKTCKAVITVEEHMVHGGLGEACAAVLAQADALQCRFRMAAIPDEYTVTGSQADIFRHYGLTMEGLASLATNLLSTPSQE